MALTPSIASGLCSVYADASPTPDSLAHFRPPIARRAWPQEARSLDAANERWLREPGSSPRRKPRVPKKEQARPRLNKARDLCAQAAHGTAPSPCRFFADFFFFFGLLYAWFSRKFMALREAQPPAAMGREAGNSWPVLRSLREWNCSGGEPREDSARAGETHGTRIY